MCSLQITLDVNILCGGGNVPSKFGAGGEQVADVARVRGRCPGEGS